MRVVIYDREDMEPITVITLPGWGQAFLREIEEGKRGPEITFPVTPPLKAADFSAAPAPIAPLKNHCCRLRFEPVWDRSDNKRRRMMWLCTTSDGESALLLKSTFLPGQQAAVQAEREQAFVAGLIRAIGAQ